MKKKGFKNTAWATQKGRKERRKVQQEEEEKKMGRPTYVSGVRSEGVGALALLLV
jgi:hypothetical protein